MVPFQSILTPLFLVLHTLNLQNSLLGLALVNITFQMPFSVFMLRNSFDGIPRELDDSAAMDSNLETKFADLAEGILTTQQIHQLIDLCLGVEKLSSAAEIAKAAIPT